MRTEVNTRSPQYWGEMQKYTHYYVKSNKMMLFAKCYANADFPQARSIFSGHRRQTVLLEGISIGVISFPGLSTETGTE